MSRFRKKPVVVEAQQVTRQSVGAVAVWCNGEVRRDDQSGDPYISLYTLESHRAPLNADLGDWVICGVQGEFYPCKPDIFAATYEPVEDE